MKQIIYFLLVLTLLISCGKQSTPEEIRFNAVIEHLKDHYKSPEYEALIEDSTKIQRGFENGKNLIIVDENRNSYYYYNEKGDKVKGYVYLVKPYTLNKKTNSYENNENYIKIVIVSENNEVVWCGTDYPSDGCEGECTNKFTNLDKCNFEFSTTDDKLEEDTIAIDLN